MAVLSVIVPVFEVEQYLSECLDSVLAATASDEIEVIAVDDGSPDGCAAILADYAARDSRLRVVTLPTNQGLGRARNAGLDHARGAYIWFVDADDWLIAGAVDMVVRRLRRTEPDVLIVGYERVYPDGSGEWIRVPGRPAGPTDIGEVVRASEHPELLHGLHIACNKVIRRDFLRRLGVRFESGWYEDVSFVYPVLLAAERVDVCDHPCYGYRQHRAGAITRTRADRHFEVFGHWRRVFDFVDSHGATYDEARPIIFQRMVWHLLAVLGHPDRLHPHQRRAFFAAATAAVRELRPAAGNLRPAGLAAVKISLVGIGSFRLFAAARAVLRGCRRVAGGHRSNRRRTARLSKAMSRGVRL